jgi:3-methyladenine DNA glycosylase/8-oxoguanine DNA glycosylase
MQFSWRKAEYIVNLARLVASRELKLEEFPQLPNDEVIERITQVKGLGRWTADWLLARGLGRDDVIAAGDLGVRKAVGRFYYDGQLPSIDDVRILSARWGTFQNLAVHYLLAGLRLPDLPPTARPPDPPDGARSRASVCLVNRGVGPVRSASESTAATGPPAPEVRLPQ